MIKILGIIGSPRKLGNSEIMIKEISRNISEPHELVLLRLTDFNIGSCRGCYNCLFKEERCVLDDDLYTVVDAMCAADAIILAAPTYFLGVNTMDILRPSIFGICSTLASSSRSASTRFRSLRPSS